MCYFLAVMVQEDYHSQNPYHNAVHAADVTQAMHCYLKEPKVRECSHSYTTCTCRNTSTRVHSRGLCAHLHTFLPSHLPALLKLAIRSSLWPAKSELIHEVGLVFSTCLVVLADSWEALTCAVQYSWWRSWGASGASVDFAF